MRIEYRVLGPLEVVDGGGHMLPLGGAMQQSVLASLLLRAGQTVTLDRLVDELWEEPPATAARTVQAYVSRLRRTLPDGVIESRPGGYTVLLEGGKLDLDTFERQLDAGHAALVAGECELATGLLREALALWRGPALAGLTSDGLRRQAERLEELRLGAVEDKIEAELGAGREAEVTSELQALVAEYPFREHLRAQLMRALYRSGRSSEALAQYREARRLLVDELGMEPSTELRELEQAILRQDPGLESPRVTPARPKTRAEAPLAVTEPAPAQGQPREVRKTVTVLFCDVVGSTSQAESSDPEVVRALLARYFERMKAIVEYHGGSVEKFIGDAVMAVFGVPVSHEDDALRACRAALEMCASFRELGIEGRIGVNTGEVVTGTAERLVTGDPVNVAARLQQAAVSGTVLIGAPTIELARGAAQVEALEPLMVKGKAEPIEAFRLVAVHEAPRPHETEFVGREKELAAIRETWQRALTERRCQLFTIVGEAGAGKSRLVSEALAALDAEVVEGRCLPYGEGITYWPVVEVIKQLDALPSNPAAAAAIRSVLRETEEAGSAEEIAWGFRKLLEERAPLIVVFDDVQWGEETFLDLVEHAALLSTSASILVLCLARPELRQRRPEWPIGQRLEPLPEEDLDRLIPNRFEGELREAIRHTSGGNPLFVTEMVAMAEETDGEVAVPPTLRALLAARLDQLEPAERSILEFGAIEGEIFHRDAVQALSDTQSVTPRLASLVRKGLISPDEAQIPGEDAFRFRHLLICDAAYEALPKAKRAELHERFAGWLVERAQALAELDEIVGHHLERAVVYKQELGEHDSSLAERAGDSLATAGRRALWRGDLSAAGSLLERALVLTRPMRLDIHLEVDFASTQRDSAPERAVAIAEAAARRAHEAGDGAGESLARVVAASERHGIAESRDLEGLETLAGNALPLLERAKDYAGLVHVWVALGSIAVVRCRYEERARVAEQALKYARLAGQERNYLFGLDFALVLGPRPADEALQVLEAAQPRSAHPGLSLNRALLLAMLGQIDEAWALADDANVRYGELTGRDNSYVLAEVATLAGDHSAAAGYLRTFCNWCEDHGQRGHLSTYAPTLGRSLCTLGRHDEAKPLAELGRELGDERDVSAQALWRRVEALVLANRGDYGQAECLAREAVAISELTDALNLQAGAFCDLAEVLAASGRTEDAAATLQEAMDRYERKKNLAMVARVRPRLAELRAGAS